MMLLNSRSSCLDAESEIVVYYFGRALASPFEIKVTDEELRAEGIRSP
jgi:hypothetical protein